MGAKTNMPGWVKTSPENKVKEIVKDEVLSAGVEAILLTCLDDARQAVREEIAQYLERISASWAVWAAQFPTVANRAHAKDWWEKAKLIRENTFPKE